MRLRPFALVVLFPLLALAPEHAYSEALVQGPSADATIVGFVVGPDDARLPGTTITITELATGRSRVIVTAEHGGYRCSGLPAGEYELKAELHGFETRVVSRVVVAAGETREVDFTLGLAGVAERVDVVGAVVRASLQASEIRETPARDVGEALTGVTGVYKVRKGAIGNDVVLHGFQSRDLTILIDGQRVYGACPSGMDPAVFHADFAEVDRLEVGKGPFDMKHGGSLGGVVNVVTHAPATGLHATPSFSIGSFGFVNPSATASYGGENWSVLGGYSYRTSDPYRDGSGTLFTQYANYKPGAVGTTAFAAHTGWVRGYLTPGNSHRAEVAYTRQRVTDLRYPYLQMDGIRDNADRFSGRYAIADSSGFVQSISAQGYVTNVSHWMTDQDRVSSAGMPRPYSMASQADTRTTGGSVEIATPPATIGVEAFRRRWNVTSYLAVNTFAAMGSLPDVFGDNVGVYAEHRRAVTGSTRLDLGGRVDWVRTVADPALANTDLYYAYKGSRQTGATDAGLSGKLRVTHRISDQWDINAGVGRTFRPPDPQERYYAMKRMGTDWVGNPHLQPTTNTGWNAGTTYRYRRIVASLGVFYDHLANFITVHNQRKVNPVPGIVNAKARSYENVNARMWSGEADLTWQFTDRLFATFNGSYTRGTKDTSPTANITSPNIAEIHPPTASMSVRYDRSVVFAEVQGTAAARQAHVDTDLLEEQLPGYAVLNLRGGVQKGNLRVTVALDNVFNRLYVDQMSYQRDPFRSGVRVREPGRNVYVNTSYRF